MNFVMKRYPTPDDVFFTETVRDAFRLVFNNGRPFDVFEYENCDGLIYIPIIDKTFLVRCLKNLDVLTCDAFLGNRDSFPADYILLGNELRFKLFTKERLKKCQVKIQHGYVKLQSIWDFPLSIKNLTDAMRDIVDLSPSKPKETHIKIDSNIKKIELAPIAPKMKYFGPLVLYFDETHSVEIENINGEIRCMVTDSEDSVLSMSWTYGKKNRIFNSEICETVNTFIQTCGIEFLPC